MRLNNTGWLGCVTLAGALGLSVTANAQPGASQPRSVKAVSATGTTSQSPVTPGTPSVPGPVGPGAPVTPELQPAGGPPNGEAQGPMDTFNPLLNNVTDFVKSGAPKQFPLRMTVLLDTSVGAGNFMLNDKARQNYVSNTVRLAPRLTLWKSLGISARLDVTKEWISSYTQSTTIPNQVTLGDLWMGVSMPQIYTEEFTGIGFGAGVWTFAPTSVQSRAETLVTAVRPYALVNWNKWGFFASYNFSFRKNFHEYVNPTVDARQSYNQDCPLEGKCMWAPSVSAGPAVNDDETRVRVSGNRILDLRRRNISHSFINILSAGYTFFDVLTPSATFMMTNSFRYPLDPSTQFTSPNARNNPWGHSDTMIGVLDVTFQAHEKVYFSTGMFTLQPVFADHRGSGLPGWNQDGTQGGVQAGRLIPNFPFYDFFTPGNNYTSFYFDITLSI